MSNIDQVRPDVAQVLSRLKDFQRTTVEHVHARLWTDPDPTRRFLVADEVGLGKTLVARGVVARAIDHLWEREERIDVIYICSNSQIAGQNLGRLAMQGFDISHADRLTMLPEALKDLRSQKVNFISFTPGTSFQISKSGGLMRERVLLHRMLAFTWGREVLAKPAWRQFFRGNAELHNYERELRSYRDDDFDARMAREFAADVDRVRADSGKILGDDLRATVDEFRYLRGKPREELSTRRFRLIGQLRALIARAAVEALEPDLVILDEFQRFKDLLDKDTAEAELAHAIFDQPKARVLLLSATPYKMYTLPNEAEGDDHYEDFRRTVRFLAGDAEATAVMSSLGTLRRSVLDGFGTDVGRAAKLDAEARLRRVMSRTERLRSRIDLDGMLREMPMPARTPSAADLLAYVDATRVAACLNAPDLLEYWRASPYLFNIMEAYKVKHDLKTAVAAPSMDLLSAFNGCSGLLRWDDLQKYRQLDPGNAKMRGLIEDVLDRGVWQLLWMPPSLPYYEPGGKFADPALRGFTKRLIFSAWNVVPKAVAVVLSYEAERRALVQHGQPTRSYTSARPRGLLRFGIGVGGRPTGMPLFALLYPSPALAALGDPLVLARSEQQLPLSRGRLLELVEKAVRVAIANLPPGDEAGPVDQRWYWAAPLLLDADAQGQAEFLDSLRAWDFDSSEPSESGDRGLGRHIDEAIGLDRAGLGRRPEDLPEVLAELAVSGPGVVALRALSRQCPELALDDESLRDDASVISWALRSLFNRPESMSIVRASEDSDVYWRAVLRYCMDGNLQAVVDEYLHVLIDGEGNRDKEPADRAWALREVVTHALSYQATNADVDEIRASRSTIRMDTHKARVHFAARFGRSHGDDVSHESRVRDAYNSPFWPFVLASTSVGQEGLDFHQYSHAIVHWNLPGNPVDLEQREGRVHRYKGHAIRRNVALTHGQSALDAVADPWDAIFAAAKRSTQDSNDLVPYWVYAPPGGHGIERYVPATPLSKEEARYRRLMRTVGAYRLVMGQPRQEDLLRYLRIEGGDLDWLRIDLSPEKTGS